MIRRALISLAILVAPAWLGACASPQAAWVRHGPGPCRASPTFAAAAEANAGDLDTLAWAPFGPKEIGWRAYAPRMAAEIGSECAPETPAFAEALARWQVFRSLPADGRMDPALFDRMKAVWQGRRGFVALRAQGLCPEPPGEGGLVHAAEDEATMGKDVRMTQETLAALRRMRRAARRDLRPAPADPALMVFSAYRSPAADADRCAREGGCDGAARAECSAHRTGTAIDLALGAAPGFSWDSTAAANRLFQSGTPSYRWLLANAGRFGFVNYAYEPWHWEFQGKGGG